MYAFRDQESPPSRKDAAVTALLQIGLAAVRAAHGIHHSPDTETRARMKEGMREVVAVVDEGVKLDDRMKRYVPLTLFCISPRPSISCREDDAHRRRLAKTPMSLDQTAPALVTQSELLSPIRRPGTPTSLTSSIPPSKRSRLSAMTRPSSCSSSLPVFRTPGFGLPPAEAAAARTRDPWVIHIASPNKNIPSSITTSRYPPKSRK